MNFMRILFLTEICSVLISLVSQWNSSKLKHSNMFSIIFYLSYPLNTCLKSVLHVWTGGGQVSFPSFSGYVWIWQFCLDLNNSRTFLRRGRVFLSRNFIIFTNILLDLYCSVFAIFFVLLPVEAMRCVAEV